MFFVSLHSFQKEHSLFKLLFVFAVFITVNACSIEKEQQPDTTLLQGTWKGTASYKQITEYKVYAPQLEDSLTSVVDSMIVQEVVLDIAKEKIQLYGFKNVASTPYTYHRDENQMSFQKGIPAQIIKDSTVSIRNLITHPSANILKLDTDSLVLQLAIYNDGWDEYLLKLKRK